jgi:hypothetical protein
VYQFCFKVRKIFNFWGNRGMGKGGSMKPNISKIGRVEIEEKCE